MVNPFAAIESALDAVPLAVFSNAEMRWSGSSVNGVFDRTYIDTLGIANSAPNFTCSASCIAQMDVGGVVVIKRNGIDTSYTVRAIQSGSSNVARLVLETV